jgi:hypothetical protein
MRRASFGFSMGMSRQIWVVLATLALGCAKTAHIDLVLDVRVDDQCMSTAPGNPPPPMSCGELTLDCADHVLFRVRAVMDGRPADIISSRCLGIEDVGRPRDLCALAALSAPSR